MLPRRLAYSQSALVSKQGSIGLVLPELSDDLDDRNQAFTAIRLCCEENSKQKETEQAEGGKRGGLE